MQKSEETKTKVTAMISTEPNKDRDALATRLQEMEMVCQLWIAAGQAKDERIEELEEEVRRLRQRTSRLARLLGSAQGRARKRQASCGR